MPALEGLNKKYTSHNVAVIGILLDAKREKRAREIIEETGTTFTHLKDDGRFAKHVYGVPQAVLVDSKGNILALELGKRSLEQFSTLIDSHL